MPQKRVFISDSLAILQEALVAAVHTLKAADSLTPLTIIVPSDVVGSQLSNAIARAGNGHIGLRFTTLLDYAVRLTEARLRQEGKRRVSAALVPLLVKRLLLEQARQPRFPKLLSETLSDLKQADVRPHHLHLLYTRIPAQEVLYRGKIRQLLDLYTRYEKSLDERQLVDDANLFTVQVQAALRDGPLLVYGGLEYTARQRHFLETLFTQRDTLVFLPWRPGSAYEAATPTLSWLTGLGFQSSPLARPQAPSCSLAQVQARLFERAGETPQRPVSTRPDASLHIISAPDQTQEAREIARTIFSLVREQDYAFDEIGVLLTESNTYGPLLRETLSRLGIPCTLVAEQPLLATRQGKAVQALCQLLSENCSRQRLFAFLRLARPPFQDLIGEAVSRAHIAQWEALCLEAGIGHGGQEWHVRLAALETRYQNPSEGQAERLAPALRLLVRFMDRLLTDVKMVQDQHTWEGWLIHFLRMYADYVSGEVSWSDEEPDRQGTGEQSLNIGETLRSLSPLLAETTRPAEWVETVLGCLAWGKVQPRKTHTTGVFLGEVTQATGLRFRAVILPGLAQESGARRASQDPILSDAERQHLAEVLTMDVPVRRQAVERRQLLFMLATQSAQEMLCLTYPRTVQGAARPPATLLLQTVSVLCGRQATPADLQHSSRWVSAAGGYAQSTRPAVDALEFHLAYAFSHAQQVAAHTVQPGLQTLPFFVPAARALEQRWERPSLTAFDGCMQAESVKSTLRRHLFPQGLHLSASSLETYARCPFRYFLETVLALKPWEEPEQILALLPRDRGVLVHTILHDFFSRLQQTDQLPLSTQRADDERRLLTQVAEEQFAVFAQTRPVGLPLLWECEREHLLRRLHAFLQRERQTTYNFYPAAFEVFFGIRSTRVQHPHTIGGHVYSFGTKEPEEAGAEFFSAQAVPFRLDTGEEVQLRGRIDRIDVSAEHIDRVQPRQARILDYKTGRAPTRGFAGGTALQLALYLYAAQYLRPDLDWVRAEYMSVDGVAQPDKKSLTAEAQAATLGTLRTIITRLAEGITAGLFFPVADACQSCAFPEICSAHGSEWAVQKLHDPHTTAWRWVRSQA
ncbi:MAG: PD-(D/E)XK nuclease family protein [Desulfurellaceae bacterium]|nr:PD-(D/E)XK nuclease family protein [Desulfurellaceae bacterium]